MMSLPTCTDYINLMESPALIKVRELFGGQCERTRLGKLKRYCGGFCIVFPFIVGSTKYALRCWHASVGNMQERTKIVSEYLSSCHLPYFVNFTYYPEGILTPQGLMPIVVMEWIKALPIKEYIKSRLNNASALIQLARNFYDMVVELHVNNISHGDLQHGNILVTEEGELKLVDYDSMYVPGLDNFEDEIKGLRGYQHHSRWNNKNASPKADYFSELIIYTSIIALSKNPQLWDTAQMNDSEFMLFSDEDIENPLTSNTFSYLSSDDELRLLGERIIEFIGLKSIEEILPLEEAIIPPKKLSEKLSESWNNNGYQPPLTIKCNPEEIINKWNKEPMSAKEDLKKVSIEISKKW